MGLTKKEAFSKKQNEIATFAKAVAHPARVAILQFLIKHKQCTCGDLVDELPLAQSTISQHLNELKAIKILDGRIDGTSMFYTINKEIWNKADSTIHQFFAGFQPSIF